MSCKTLFQYSLVKLITDLAVSAREFANSTGIEYGTLMGWINLKRFPTDVEIFNDLSRQYKEVSEYGNFWKLQNDFMEYQKRSNNWPTSSMIKIMEERGFTYYKSKGEFQKSGEVKKTEKAQGNLHNLLESVQNIGDGDQKRQGRSLADELTKIIGEIPKYENFDISCITDGKTYQEVFDELDKKCLEIQKISHDLMKKKLILRGLRIRYEELTEFPIDERDLDGDSKRLEMRRSLSGRF